MKFDIAVDNGYPEKIGTTTTLDICILAPHPPNIRKRGIVRVTGTDPDLWGFIQFGKVGDT
jgi:hypothetical protein